MIVSKQKQSHILELRHKSERGQGFTELAISLVFLLVLFSVVVDLGWSLFTLIALRDAAQEAASYAAMCPVQDDNTTANTDMIEERLLLSTTAPIDLTTMDPDDFEVEIWFTAVPNTNPSQPINITPVTRPVMGGNVVVRVTIQHKIMTPFVGAFIGRQEYPLTVQIAETVMRSEWLSQCDY